MTQARVFAFDFDGVIADSAPAYVAAINAAAEPLGATRRMDLQMLADMPAYAHALSARQVGLSEARTAQYSAALREHFHRQAAPPLHRCMGAVLERLSTAGEVIVLSANAEAAIAAALTDLGVQPTAVYAGRAASAKAEVLKLLSERAKVVMVGDTLADCHAARDAGVAAVAVAWGWQSEPLLASAGVPVMANAVDLEAWLLAWSVVP